MSLMATSTSSMAQTSFPIPDGEITIYSNGTFTGTHEWVGVYPGFPNEIDRATISGVISPSGTISGSFTGTSTFNVDAGNGNVVQQEEPISGSITGSINSDGTYTVNWSGTESGSHSGVFPAYTIVVGQGNSSSGGSSGSSGKPGNSQESASGPTPPPPGPDGGVLGGFGFTFGSGSSNMCEA